MISVILSLLVSAATPPPPPIIFTPSYSATLPPLTGNVPEVRAKANLPSYFTTMDYPAAARRAGEQGTVGFTAAVDPTGRVTACAITASSGSPSLDYATCAIISRRARFTPAQDGAGRAVADRIEARTRWVLPPAPPTPYADRRMALIFTTDAAGAVTACRPEASTEVPKSDRLCDSMIGQARAIAAIAMRTQAMANRELVLEQGVLVGGPDRVRGIGTRSGEASGTMFALALEIDAGGAIAHCEGANGDEDARRVAMACAESGKRPFVPTDNASANAAVRRAVRYFASYTRPIG